jgi:hypothetical protein
MNNPSNLKTFDRDLGFNWWGHRETGQRVEAFLDVLMLVPPGIILSLGRTARDTDSEARAAARTRARRALYDLPHSPLIGEEMAALRVGELVDAAAATFGQPAPPISDPAERGLWFHARRGIEDALVALIVADQIGAADFKLLTRAWKQEIGPFALGGPPIKGTTPEG